MKVYADHAATTPMRPEAKKAMIEALEDFGNPSSIHALGRLASAKMESARKEIAELLNCRPAEVYFTSGGSEADNWAIRAARYGAGDVVASAFEHHAVLHTLEAMERSGTRRAVLVAPGTNGIVDPAEIGRRVSSTTNMVTVMAANNEVGTLQPIREISKEIRKHGSKLTVFHTDAVQAIGHIPVDVQKMGVDMLSLSAHKFGGPKGIGVLYCRQGVQLDPLLYGGGKNGGAVLERRMSPLLLAWRRLCVQLARIWRTARTPSGACVIACCSALGKSKEAAYMGAWKPACLGISTVPLRALRVKQWSLCWTWLGFAFLQVLPARLAAENRAMY